MGDHHATIFVAPEAAGPIEAVRRVCDPIMAAQIAAHVTLAYPHEAPNIELLSERLRAATTSVSSFRLRLGEVAHFGRPEDGVHVSVEDVDGGYRALRAEILRPPFTPGEFLPHVTLLHPRTSPRGRECWDTLRGRRVDLEFTVRAAAITVFDGAKWNVAETVVFLRSGFSFRFPTWPEAAADLCRRWRAPRP